MRFTNTFKDEKLLKNKFLKNINNFKKEFNNKKVFVNNYIIDDNHLNFYNFSNDNIKTIIDHEILSIYNEFPNASDLLLEWIVDFYFSNSENINNYDEKYIKTFIKNKIKIYENFISRPNKELLYNNCMKKINSENIKNIFKTLIDYSDADDVIFVEKSNRLETIIKKTSQTSFLIEFDEDFLLNQSSIEKRDYNYIIIDGYINSVSEIYHLLEKANETKEPYVIFCKGMNVEVKDVIIKNILRGTIDILPISLKINEENVNVLNDIASCHDNKMISSFQGDTISSAIRRDLKKGKYIKLTQKSLIIKCNNEIYRKNQIKFLNDKIKNLNDNDPNKNFISKRIKNLNAKKIHIYLGKNISNLQSKELNKIINLYKNLKKGIIYTKNKEDFICYIDLYICINKFLSITNIIKQLGGAIVLDNEK